MKVLGIVRSVNLVLAGMLAGNEFGTWAAVHPSLGKVEWIEPEKPLQRHKQGA